MKHFLIIFISFLISCSHNHQKAYFQSKLEAGECLDALNNIPESKRMKVISTSKKLSGGAASYLLTGIGYTSDVIVFITGSLVVGGVVCAPLAFVEASIPIHGVTGECIKLVSEAVLEGNQAKKFYSLGGKVYEQTDKWRCPRLNPISRSIRKVAECYKDKGDFQMAKQQLKNLQIDPLFKRCLSKKEKSLIISEFEQL